MTNPEFNLQFDILYNNISSNKAPGLSLYEKSVFLTQAQDQILKAYLDPKKNKLQEGYDESIARQIDFSTLNTIKEFTYTSDTDEWSSATDSKELWRPTTSLSTPTTTSNNTPWHTTLNVTDLKILYIVNEILTVERNGLEIPLQVAVLDNESYSLIQSKAFKYPVRYQAWRLINSIEETVSGSETSILNRYFEFIAGFKDIIKSYKIKYVRQPRPIIIATSGSSNGQEPTINGESIYTESTCELDPILHQDILRRAVELAKLAYETGALAQMVQIGNASSTELGILTAPKEN